MNREEYTMSKPTLFFSHSSKDKDLILALKNKFDEFTGGVLDIFMSSDGQSIPFGTNWIHKIEKGLQEAKIMFVFVTDNSISSGWIYFEAGYAYSKGIQVIPVGVGIDIGELKAPLNLLQGFNISSEESLNNFITIANRVFDYHFSEQFTEKDYKEILEKIEVNAIKTMDFEKIVCLAECDLSSEYNDNYLEKIIDYLSTNNIPFSKKGYGGSISTCIVANGVKIEYNGSGKVYFSVSTYNFQKSLQLLMQLLKISKKAPKHYLRLHLRKPYDCVTAVEDISSILTSYDEFVVEKGHIGGYAWNNLGFYIFDNNKSTNKNTPEYVISVTYDCDSIRTEEVMQLICLLYEIGIIYKNH